MLYRGDLSITTAETGGEVGLIDPVCPGGDVPDWTQVGATKHDARVHWRRTEHNDDLVAGMKPYASRLDRLLQSALPKHGFPLSLRRNITRARYRNPALLPRLFTPFQPLQRLEMRQIGALMPSVCLPPQKSGHVKQLLV